ncbi:MAG: protease modulator HflC [Desulfarculales bacterium]|jgi:membrane protease subunit HflC|nr:protease modulator HflC [Desulfarculales bacterium]
MNAQKLITVDQKKVLPIIIILALLIVVASGSFFVVQEGYQAIVTQFGRPVGEPYKEAGLYFKIPFIQEVHNFDKRLLKWDGKPNEIPTRDKKFIWVYTTARWRIVDPLLFLQTMATEAGAITRLDDILNAVIRDQVSNNLLVELVRSADWNPSPPPELSELRAITPAVISVSGDDMNEPATVSVGRATITRRMLEEARKLIPQYGIELIDMQIKRINFIDTVLNRVYERMISERKRIASQYRSEGEGESKRVLGTMEKELARIRSDAYRRSQEIRGAADGQANIIFGTAFGKDPEFYSLFRSLEMMGAQQGKTDYIFSTDSEFFRYLKDSSR